MRAEVTRERLPGDRKKQDIYDVAVVGLGPVGCAAALLCAREGLRTLVIEKESQPYPKPRAVHFDAEIMRVFQSVGVADEIEATTLAMGGSVYLGADGRPIRRFRARDTRSLLGWAPSYLFYQPELESRLRARLARVAHVTTCLRSECVGIEQHADHARLQVFDCQVGREWTASARFVLACDGASSALRKMLSITLEDLRFEESWLVVDALVQGPMRWPAEYEIPDEVREGACSLMVCDPQRPSTVIPGPGRHRRWEFMLRADESSRDGSESEWVSRLVGRWIDPANVQIVRAAVYQFHGLIARDWNRGRVFLLGDAAHQTPPFYGQGMCHGIRDAANLAWKLHLVLEGRAPPALLETYQVERHPHVQAIVESSIAAGAAICIRDAERARERDRAFRESEAARVDSAAMTDIVPPLKTGIIARSPGQGDLRGARFIQPRVASIDGAIARLDDLLDHRPALLAFGVDPLISVAPAIRTEWERLRGVAFMIQPREQAPVTAPRRRYEVLVDADGQLQEWFAAASAQVALVRPDRYVYGTARANDAAALVSEFVHSIQAGVNAEPREPSHANLPTASGA